MNRFNMPARLIRPPNNPGLSIAAATARQGQGLTGVYYKTDYKVLARNNDVGGSNSQMLLPDITTKTDKFGNDVTDYLLAFSGLALTQGIFLNAEVVCPSARCRVAFGVNVLRPADSLAFFVNGSTNPYAYFNVIPGVKINQIAPETISGQDGGGDNSEIISGQPVYPFAAPGTGPSANNPIIFDPSDYFIGGYDGSAGNSGGMPTPNGIGFPFAYDAIDSATNYRIRGGVFTGNSGDLFTGPIFVWARWEIVDPRNKEDSEALLNECRLVPTPVQLYTSI